MRWCSWLRHCVIRREVAGSSFDGVIEIFHSLILPTTLRSNRNEYFLGSKGGLRDSNGLRVGRKMANFQLYFQSREQVVVRRGQIRRIGWVIKTVEVQVGQFLLGCKCPVSRDVVVQKQDHLGDLPAAFFLQNVLQLHQQK